MWMRAIKNLLPRGSRRSINLSRWLRGKIDELLYAPPKPPRRPAGATAAVVSFYMSNMPRRVVNEQRRVLDLTVPEDIAIEQVLASGSHGEALTRFMRTSGYKTVLFLDIDAFPLNREIVPKLVAEANQGILSGTVTRSGSGHPIHHYVGPFGMAITRATYDTLGQPDFEISERGDCGEEITYAAETRGVPIKFYWPIAVETPKWDLGNGLRLGQGTTYEGGIWHAFEIRRGRHHRYFVRRARELVPRI